MSFAEKVPSLQTFPCDRFGASTEDAMTFTRYGDSAISSNIGSDGENGKTPHQLEKPLFWIGRFCMWKWWVHGLLPTQR
jgi:hypothetical protein